VPDSCARYVVVGDKPLEDIDKWCVASLRLYQLVSANRSLLRLAPNRYKSIISLLFKMITCSVRVLRRTWALLFHHSRATTWKMIGRLALELMAHFGNKIIDIDVVLHAGQALAFWGTIALRKTLEWRRFGGYSVNRSLNSWRYHLIWERIFFFGNGWKNHGHFIFSEPKIIMSAWEAQHFIIFTQKTRESNRIGALEFLKS